MSAIGDRRSAIGNRQSAIGNRQSAIGLLLVTFASWKKEAAIRKWYYFWRSKYGRRSSGTSSVFWTGPVMMVPSSAFHVPAGI